MSQIRRALWTALAALMLSVAAGAQTTTVAGRWNVEATSLHGPVTGVLVLEQEGTRVAGSLTFPGSDALTLAGELVDARLSLETPADAKPSLSLRGTLSADAITGYVSTDHGDIKFTATRVPRS